MGILSDRLLAVARMAEGGRRVVDVGTDHGYLPVYLAQQGGWERIAACDIREGPLQRAVASARKAGVEEKIEFTLSDGLSALDGGFDTVVMAGMGGETMVGILARAPWLSDGPRLILQPQSKLETLISWLDANGFTCLTAKLVRDGGKLYLAFTARGGNGGFDLLGSLRASRDPLLGEFLARARERLARELEGMERGGRTDSEQYARACHEKAAVEAALGKEEGAW